MGSRAPTPDKHALLDVKQRALLYEVVSELAGRIDLDELIRIVIAKAKEILGAESAAILLWDADANELYFPYIDDVDADVEQRFREVRFPADRGIAGWVLQNGRPDLVLDARKDPRWYPDVDRKSGMHTTSLLCAPLRGRHGTLGVIQLRNKREGDFGRADLGLLDALADSVATTLESARTFADEQRRKEHLQAQLVAMQRSVERERRFDAIVGSSQAMQGVFQLMESTLTAPISVLLVGETGTGKELIARAIHDNGPRKHRPFVAVNCAALQESLAESQLFGHRKGSFTGALENHHGFFEVADGGTIFLDEIGDMPVALQVKLLRVLQERQILRVGDAMPTPVDVRVISATNRDLAAARRSGDFREDLYFRLAAFPIEVPPLRQRREDIPALAGRLLQRIAGAHAKSVAGFAPEVLERFAVYDWPGNVRELQNEIERAVALVKNGEHIGCAELSTTVRGSPAPQEVTPAGQDRPLKDVLASFERSYLEQALERHERNVTRAAAALGMSRTGLHNKLRSYGIERPDGAQKRKRRTPAARRPKARK